MSTKMLNDSSFRRSPNCSKFSLLIASKDPHILDFQSPHHPISGKELTEDYILQNGFDFPILIKDSKESIDLKVPNNVKSLSDIAKIIGPDFQVKIIDVGAQHEIEGWTISDYAQYLEQRGKMHKVLNMITLEASATPLTSQLLAPGIVRNMDWIDTYWPFERRARGADYPRVQKYVLAGMGGAYTDFHVDFGGTSVWYHVLVGEKVFYVIPPSEANLRAYCNWITSANQDSVYLPDTLPNPRQCQRITIKAGQTLFLPGGWIHSVYTPVDSLVFGGNFLFSPCILRQLQIYHLEITSRVPRKYLFPYYKQMTWYVVCCSLQRHRHDMKHDSSLPPPYPSILMHPRVVYQWVYLIKICEIWITDTAQLLDDKVMFEEIASEAYELSSDTKEKSHLPQQMCDVVVPGVSTSNEYLSSISQHIQRIRSISNADFDLLSNMSLTTHPYHTTYDNFGSDMVPIDPSDEKSVTFEEKPEIKIRLKLSSQTSHQPNVSLESGKSSKGIKLKLTLPPPPESERSRDSASHRSPSREDAPLSRTRGKRLPLSFLQSVTDIDLLPTETGNNEATADSDPLLLPGDDEVWKEEEEEEDFLNDTDAREQIRADYIEDYLDNDEYEHSKSQSKKRKVVSRHERASPPSVVQAPKKSKQKLGPGALLRKKLSGKYL